MRKESSKLQDHVKSLKTPDKQDSIVVHEPSLLDSRQQLLDLLSSQMLRVKLVAESGSNGSMD